MVLGSLPSKGGSGFGSGGWVTVASINGGKEVLVKGRNAGL
jgi:hypothetical protein